MNLQLVDGETGETLEAALAFIDDEYGHDLSDSASERHTNATWPNSPDAPEYQHELVNSMCGSLTLPSIATCITPRATEKIETHRKKSSSRKSTTTGTGPSVRRNRSRDRQRLEILQLRAQAEVLEKRVTDMRDKQRERENDNTLWITNTIKGTPRHYQRHHRDSLLFDALKDLAKRHRKLRKDSEHENKSLRNVYRTQLTTIEMLKKLLQSQEKMKRSVRFTSQNYYVESYFDADENALVVMDRLSDALDSLHVSTDCVFQSNGLAAITSAFTQANMNQSTETVTNVEVLNCRVLPFDFRDVGKAYWYEMTKNYVANEIERGQSPEAARESAIQQAFTMEVDDDGVPTKFQFRYAGDRKIEQNREVIVLSGQNQLLQAQGMTIDGVSIKEKLWLVLSELSPGVTVVKVCMGMSIQFDCDVPNRQQFVDRLCGLLVRQKQLGFESVLHGVEHSLLLA